MAGGVSRSTITGAKDLDKLLKRLPGKVAGRILQSSLRVGAMVIVKDARTRAPVGTGTLRREIVARKTSRAKASGKSAEVTIGPTQDAFWGLFQEFGTRFHPPHPWLRPAFEASKRAALDKTGKSLGMKIEKAAEKLAGSFAKSGLKARRRRR